MASADIAPIDALDNIGRDLRNAILKALPCAYEQYVTISIPGRVIDTKVGGEFNARPQASAGELHQIRVNEAKLVDSMIPLDTVMLGPTGKSVARSYLAALDYLIPIESEVGLPNQDTRDPQKPATKYQTAMDYLRRPIMGPEGPKTVVDIYVKKQEEYTKAQIEWDNIQDKNAEDIRNNATGMTAEDLEKRTSRMRRAKFALQARWMDWVVNGDKILVDHHFAVVDISTVMARIEASKEAARAANIMDLVDGTQWAQVSLQPPKWAEYCRQKAEGWTGRNPLSPAVIEMEIKRLKKLKAAYEGYAEWAETNKDSATTTDNGEGSSNGKGKQPESDSGDTGIEEAISKLNSAQAKLNAAERKKAGGAEKPDEKTLETYREELREAKKNLHILQKDEVMKHKGIVGALQAATANGMHKTLTKTITELQNEITTLESRLAESQSSFRRTISAIVAVEPEATKEGETQPENPNLTVVRVKDGETTADRGLLAGDAAQTQPPDPWTKVYFTSSASSSRETSGEKAISGDARIKIGGLLGSVEASSSFSKVSKDLQKESMATTITGSFSALLVQITRPWLHGELFHDYEIDTPQTAKMSPGPAALKQALKDRSASALQEYGQFPAYPTAFIVAADTEIEVSCSKDFASSFIESSSKDSHCSVDYGPWTVSASANLKTENKNTNQRMEATASGMKISIQAPQIIGWVSEILPQLPRNKSTFGQGGLTGPPMNLFRR